MPLNHTLHNPSRRSNEKVIVFAGDHNLGEAIFHQADSGYSQGGILHISEKWDDESVSRIDALFGKASKYSVRFEQWAGPNLIALKINSAQIRNGGEGESAITFKRFFG